MYCKKIRKKKNKKYYLIAGITIQLESDLQFYENTFHHKFKHFEIKTPGNDVVIIKHHFFLPKFKEKDLGRQIYRKCPWIIYENKGTWTYLANPRIHGKERLVQIAVFNSDYTRAEIYNDKKYFFHKGMGHSLSFFSTDQILLARLLAYRSGFFMHSCGVNLNGNGLLFVGHCEAGKSTMATFLKKTAQILCDDRVIVRQQQKGFRIHGTWNHSSVSNVSNSSAPLKAVMFLRKAKVNRLVRLEDRMEIIKRLLGCLITPLVTVDWWKKTLTVLEDISNQVPCYELRFDKSGNVIKLFKETCFSGKSVTTIKER